MVEQLKLFFAINETIVHFIHGQVFLVLGVIMGVVALQWQQRSRLELAASLPWLAGFGILEAIATWGQSFIPIQARLLPPDTIQTLRFIQLIVYLLTFTTLFGFGLKLNEPQVPAWSATYVPLVILLVAIALLITQRAVISGVDAVQNAGSEALLRYVIGIPAALLVAYGLRQQAGRLVGPLKNTHLTDVLRVAGFGFIFYALVECLIVPNAPFFPANILNEDWVYDTTGIPIGIFRSIVGAIITWYLFRSLEAFRIEADRMTESLQQQKALITERERISRDLHDGTIQSIYAAGLMLDDVRHTLVDRQQPQEASDKLQGAIAVLDSTIQEIRGYIYDLRRSMSGDEDLARGLMDIVTEFRLRTGIATDWKVEGCGKLPLSPDRRQHVYQITREALSNIARHARATQATVELHYQECVGDAAESVRLRISDNGIGMLAHTTRHIQEAGAAASGAATSGAAASPKRANAPLTTLMQNQSGRGLPNIRERASLLKARLEINSGSGAGTEVILEVKG